MPSQGINLIVALMKKGTALTKHWFTVVYIITFKVTHTKLCITGDHIISLTE